MSWTQNPDAHPSTRIAAVISSLKPTERKVIEAVSAQRAATVEMTAQQLADHVGVSRASVIRAAQKLGYQGFPQLRVALALELAGENSVTEEAATTMSAIVRARVATLARRLEDSFSMLDDAALSATIESLDTATRVLVVANGFSGPIGLDLVQRLVSAGRSAEFHADAMSQRIAAHHLGTGSLCIVCSGSGANKSSLDVAKEAQQSGAQVIAITNFAGSALASYAHIELLVPLTNTSFQDELIHTSRAGFMVLVEQLVELFLEYRGQHGTDARAAVLGIIGDALQE